MTQPLGNGPRRVVPDLMAIAAAVGLDEVEPLVLGFEVFRDAVALVPGLGEMALVRRPVPRSPVEGGLVLRRPSEARRGAGAEVQRFAALTRDARVGHA